MQCQIELILKHNSCLLLFYIKLLLFGFAFVFMICSGVFLAVEIFVPNADYNICLLLFTCYACQRNRQTGQLVCPCAMYFCAHSVWRGCFNVPSHLISNTI